MAVVSVGAKTHRSHLLELSFYAMVGGEIGNVLIEEVKRK